MSLDIYLEGPERAVTCRCVDCGNEHQRTECDTYADFNITHNLARMAGEARLYEVMWDGSEPSHDGRFATGALCIPYLRNGIGLLRASPERFKQFNPENGWGDYDGLLRVADGFLRACEEHPDATVRRSR